MHWFAWTEVGGELLQIESVIMPGKGKAYYTGKLGDVMKESVQAAQSFVHSNASNMAYQRPYLKKMIFMFTFQKVLLQKMVHQLVLQCLLQLFQRLLEFLLKIILQ